ncbi:MAG: amidase [Gammaproteobacteria bacterium]
MAGDPCSYSGAQLQPALRQREISVLELTEAHLARIDALNPQLNAFTSVDREGACKAAVVLDQELANGTDRGPLHGIPVALKDIFAAEGLPLTAGSRILAENVATEDAETVKLLRAGGAVILGKTNLNEFAFGGTGLNPHTGAALNPWDPERIVGGSSSGSAAAVIAGMCVLALGTDTGGSTRIPASLVGIVGFKPTYERWSRVGVLPLSWSLDHVGVFGRSVADVGAAFEVLSNGRSAPAKEVDLRGLRIGILEEYCGDLDDEVAPTWQQFINTLSGAGAQLITYTPDCLQDVMAASTTIMFAEAATAHSKWLRTCRDLYSPEIRMRLLQGALLPASTYLRAQQMRAVILREISALFGEIDVLAFPTQMDVATRVSDVKPEVVMRLVRNTRLATLIGLPAMSLPLPVTALPVGAQLMAANGKDEFLLDVAASFEELLGHGPMPSMEKLQEGALQVASNDQA